MKYVARRPEVEAIQFTGLKSVHDIKFLSRALAIRYEERMGGTELYLEIGKGSTIEVRRSDYVVRNEDGINVVSEDEFRKQYEPVVTLNSADIANLNTPYYQVERNEHGFITGVTASAFGGGTT